VGNILSDFLFVLLIKSETHAVGGTSPFSKMQDTLS
jgi:hypothetical protein